MTAVAPWTSLKSARASRIFCGSTLSALVTAASMIMARS